MATTEEKPNPNAEKKEPPAGDCEPGPCCGAGKSATAADREPFGPAALMEKCRTMFDHHDRR
jgi:hypothetical protein